MFWPPANQVSDGFYGHVQAESDDRLRHRGFGRIGSQARRNFGHRTASRIDRPEPADCCKSG